MTPKGADNASVDADLPDIEDLEDESELPLEKQLELAEGRLIDADENRSGSSKAAGSEKPDTTAADDGSLSTRERELLNLAETRAELRAAKERIEALESRLVDSREKAAVQKVEFEDVGDIEESLEAIRPTLNRLGKFQIEKVQAVEERLVNLEGKMQQRIDQLEAATVMQTMKIERSQVPEIIEWARRNERVYTNAEELEKIVSDYRDAIELKELRAQRAERERAKKPDAKTNTRQRAASKSTAEDLDTLKGGDSFDRAWDKSVRKQLSELRSGRFN